MAAANGRDDSLIPEISAHPERFNFFQLVRLLHRYAENGADDRSVARLESAEDRVRFHSVAEMRFPVSAVRTVEREGDAQSGVRFRVGTTLQGLIGANGVLPENYTRMVIDGVRDSDVALQQFLDIFYHRTMLLFYRAWRKQQISVAYELARSTATESPDAFSACLEQALGLNAPGIEQLQIPASTLLHYAGCLLGGRSTAGLETILSDYFRVPVQIGQFCGRWLFLSDTEVSQVGARPTASRYARLGQDFVIGTRLWDVRSQFRIVIGPMDYRCFQRFLPIGADWPAVQQLVRFYVGMEYDFDIELQLDSRSVPNWTLSLGEESGRLGWTTWCGSGAGSGSRKVRLRVDDRM